MEPYQNSSNFKENQLRNNYWQTILTNEQGGVHPHSNGTTQTSSQGRREHIMDVELNNATSSSINLNQTTPMIKPAIEEPGLRSAIKHVAPINIATAPAVGSKHTPRKWKDHARDYFTWRVKHSLAEKLAELELYGWGNKFSAEPTSEENDEMCYLLAALEAHRANAKEILYAPNLPPGYVFTRANLPAKRTVPKQKQVSLPNNDSPATVPQRTDDSWRKWSAGDIEILLSARKAGLKFSEIQETYFPRRTTGAVSEYYHKLMRVRPEGNSKDINVPQTSPSWTGEENVMLVKLRLAGVKYSVIQDLFFPHRTLDSVVAQHALLTNNHTDVGRKNAPIAYNTPTRHESCPPPDLRDIVTGRTSTTTALSPITTSKNSSQVMEIGHQKQQEVSQSSPNQRNSKEHLPNQAQSPGDMINNWRKWTDEDNAALVQGRMNGMKFRDITQAHFPTRNVAAVMKHWNLMSVEEQKRIEETLQHNDGKQ